MSKRRDHYDRLWREACGLAAQPRSPDRDAKLRDALEVFVDGSVGSAWQLTPPANVDAVAVSAIVSEHPARELWKELRSSGAVYSRGLPPDPQARARLERRIRTLIETLADAWLGKGWTVVPRPRTAGRPRTHRLRDLFVSADSASVMTYLGAPYESRKGAWGGKPGGLRSPTRVDEVLDQATGQPKIVEVAPEPVRQLLTEKGHERLCSIVAAAWDWATLSKPDGHLRPRLRPPSIVKVRRFVNALSVGRTAEVTVLRSEIAYFLVGHRWRLSREGVRSALRKGRLDTLSR